uniref:Non-selective voltage-gated ion channel VDAC2 n=2 Tax=Astyanax mexicanus TaxID=7994 RepID=A0A8B9JHI4_ASTMX
MAVPPAYADLGKSAKDIFNKGYGFGLVKLDVKTKSANGVEFKTSGSSNTDTNKVTGNLETKYKWDEYGLTFTEKWNTDNTLGTEITVEDQVRRDTHTHTHTHTVHCVQTLICLTTVQFVLLSKQFSHTL